MATKKTDWKKERAALQDDDYPDTGRVILEKGTRKSKGDDGTFPEDRSVGEILAKLEANRKMYLTLNKNKKKKPLPFKGLFGGGE